jgi:hypothetical protein
MQENEERGVVATPRSRSPLVKVKVAAPKSKKRGESRSWSKVDSEVKFKE